MGDSEFVKGEQTEYQRTLKQTRSCANNQQPAQYERVLLGITKASLATESLYLSGLVPRDHAY